MSIKARLKLYLKDIKNSLSYFCVIGSFCLGWCSYDQMKSLFKEYIRFRRVFKLQAQGVDAPLKTYNNTRMLSQTEAQQVIGQAIEAGKPFMAGRYGCVELGMFWRIREDNKGFIAPVKETRRIFCHNAGFFPNDKEEIMKFGQLMREATRQADLMAVWCNAMEEYELRTHGNNPQCCMLNDIDPVHAQVSWSPKLEGKKVLVVHPFKDTILSQYKKRELLFPGKNTLPEFQLRVVRAVQTVAGNRDERFNTWFEALDYMYNEAMKEDFDVAIIGCGAYGFPLAAKIKQAGKIAIHLGGVTQMLFGIKGRRWENENDELCKNPHWVRPKERPEGFESIEGGCYW